MTSEATDAPQKGYVLSDKESVADILAVEAELLRSEGVDPRWPGFPEDAAGQQAVGAKERAGRV